MIKVRSSRRATGLKPTDYDHEIDLINRDATPRPLGSEAASAVQSRRESLAPAAGGDVDAERPSPVSSAEEGLLAHQHASNRDVGRDGSSLGSSGGAGSPPRASHPSIEVQAATPAPINSGAHRASAKKAVPKRETAIDILYENERGGFLCGAALFSSKALGGLDPPAWTNAWHKASPTSTVTAQVPDPSWEWVWPSWRINHQEGMDTNGWEYSFAFSPKFSWHGPKWWNSFVRRRAWTRQRARKQIQDGAADPHMLNTDYFTITPAPNPSRLSNGSLGSCAPSHSSRSQPSGSESEQRPDIEDMDTLLRTLRYARIDREKLEAMENYVSHAADLWALHEHMDEIMATFVFQASRRQLLSFLTRKHDETMQELKVGSDEDKGALGRRSEALEAATKHAQEEVAKLAYWSDVKRMAGNGELKAPPESKQDWFEQDSGLDRSGPSAPRPETTQTEKGGT